MRFFLALSCGVIAAAPAPAADPEADLRARDRNIAHALKQVRQNPRQTAHDALAWLCEFEATPRLLSILSGTPPSADKSSGWLVPSRTRYTAQRLIEQLDSDGDGAVAATEWSGRQDWFQILDRDRDGSITARDLDWSPDSPSAKANTSAKMLFRQLDGDGDGQVSAAEWQDYMQKLSQGRAHLTQDDLLPLFAGAGAAKAKSKGKGKGGAAQGKGGINMAMLKAFFEGDVGSIFEGPRPGTQAPDFTLPLVDGKGTLTLSKQFGKRPVVLVFGSFT